MTCVVTFPVMTFGKVHFPVWPGIVEIFNYYIISNSVSADPKANVRQENEGRKGLPGLLLSPTKTSQ